MEVGIPMTPIAASPTALRSETIAAFGTTCGQYLAAATGSFACTIAEFASASKFGRSECRFHEKVSWIFSKSGAEKPLLEVLSRQQSAILSFLGGPAAAVKKC